MSTTSIQGPLSDLSSSMSHRSLSVSSSLSDLCSLQAATSRDTCAVPAVMTIEELRLQLVSCFTCGVTWSAQQVSLDCAECGGYAMRRPCPLCEGKCQGEFWKRDLTMSHACGKARWEGRCSISGTPGPLQQHPRTALPPQLVAPTPPPCSAAAAAQQLAQDLCSRLEKLGASS